MNRTGWWIFGGLLATLVVLAGGWFLAVQPALAAADASHLRAGEVTAQNQVMRGTLAALTKTAAKQGELEEEDAVLRKAVPDILKPNTFSRRVDEVAAITGVTVNSWSLGEATPYTAPAGLVSAAAATADETADADGVAAAPAPTPAASALALAETDPLISGANLTVVPVSMQVTGFQNAVLDFATDIQDDERVMLLNGLATTLNENGTVTAGFTGFVYTLAR